MFFTSQSLVIFRVVNMFNILYLMYARVYKCSKGHENADFRVKFYPFLLLFSQYPSKHVMQQCSTMEVLNQCVTRLSSIVSVHRILHRMGRLMANRMGEKSVNENGSFFAALLFLRNNGWMSLCSTVPCACTVCGTYNVH